MSRREPSSEHKSAVRDIADKRQQALAAASELAKAGTPHHQTHLAPASEGRNNLAVTCTQSVVDYLLQLRPYRADSRNWKVDLGVVNLPKEIDRGSADDYGIEQSNMTIDQSAQISLRNMDQVIDAANMTISYSTTSGYGDFGVKTEGETKSYKFVFSSGQVLRLVAIADEIATDLNFLADIKTEGTSDQSGF